MNALHELATSIAMRLTEAGHTSYFAGGCVRDSLLGISPKDYDIATSATPDEVMEIFPKSDPIGAHFGVILVKENRTSFEIATFRHDGSYHDGRHPESVTFSTPEEDSSRRDFTVNGLFQNPKTGEIIDYIDGQTDLKNRTIRAIGDPATRFQEDSLRLLRAIRFSVTLDFKIEEQTWQAICDNSQLLEKVSMERIRDEFTKILISSHRAKGLELLTVSGLMKHIVPEVYDLIGCEQPPQWHPEGDVYTHTRIMLEMLEPNPSPELALSVLLHDIGKPATYSYDPEEDRIRFSGHDAIGATMSEKILRRLRYSNQMVDDVSAMVKNHMNFMNVQKMRTAKVKRFMARPTFEDEMKLHRVDCASSNGITENYDFLRLKEKEFAAEPLIPEPFITGKDLINLGMKPGPQFKQILQDLQTEQLEMQITDRDTAIEFVKKHESYQVT